MQAMARAETVVDMVWERKQVQCLEGGRGDNAGVCI